MDNITEFCAGCWELIKTLKSIISSRKARDATLWKGFATSTINTGKNTKSSRSEDLNQSRACPNLK